MDDLSYDVVVVGAGPAGSVAARHAARCGAATLLIEEHPAAGSPVQCTGLVSSKTLEVCELNAGKWIIQQIKGARVFSPDGTGISIGGEKIRAYVIDRKMFDRNLLELAAAEGADIMMKTRALALEDAGGKKMIRACCNGRLISITAGVVIGADGVQGGVARWSGLGRVQKVLSGVQIETAYEVEDIDRVEVFVGSEVPGFFGWAVPVSENTARIGLCVDHEKTRSSAYEHLMRFLQTNPSMQQKACGGYSDMLIGCIPLGPQPRTAADGVILAGDAAGQVKPTSGGGVYMSAVCAKIAGQVAAEAALEGDTSAAVLMKYDRLWRSAVGGELSTGMKIHRVFGRLSDNDFNELMKWFGEPDVLDIINRYGDIDHPSILLGKLAAGAKGRKMFKIAGIVLRAMVG